MGRRGLGHKQCPLTSAMLLDPAILSSKAFSSKGAKTIEKDNIPMWRDGENAIKIQTAESGGVTLESFHEKLSKAYGRPRSMFVPVSMPPAFLKHIKSASRRALGPHMDSHERSGIEFQMRMIGARADASQNAPAEGLEVEDEEDDKTEDDEVQDVPEVANGTDATGPLDTMTKDA